MENERTLTPFTEWINHSGKFQLNIYDKKGNLINNIEERERMKNKFNIGDFVAYKNNAYRITDVTLTNRYCGEGLFDSNLLFANCAEEDLSTYIIDIFRENIDEEQNLVKLNYNNESVEVSIDIKEYYELKEENKELRELLDIAKATIQMISELI